MTASSEQSNVDPAAARKRRKEIMLSLRESNKQQADSKQAKSPGPGAAASAGYKEAQIPDDDEMEEGEEDSDTDALPPKKRRITKKEKTEQTPDGAIKTTVITSDKKKTQIRYDPETPMDKDQLATWRREARRVRNRESAAASRQRIRDRISELEDEVNDWKTKYLTVARQLEGLQGAQANGSSSASSNNADLVPGGKDPNGDAGSGLPHI